MAAAALCATRLETLLGESLAASARGCAVDALALDSRAVKPGTAFMALAGHAGHGLDHLGDALQRGATAILYTAGDARWSAELAARCRAADVPYVAVPELARRLGAIAARFHGNPSRKLESVAAVTGTDGKTSVSHFIAAMLDDVDAPAAVLGTLGRGRSGQAIEAGLTTPDAISLQAALAELAGAGMRRIALEASSHGLAQHRIDGTRIDVAVLTQLGRDHLDYHADAEDYAAAKARLFHWPDLAAAVLNRGDAFGRRLDAELPRALPRVRYGDDSADLALRTLRCEATGMRFELVAGGEAFPVRVPLLGTFNADNLLAAAGALLALGHAPADVAARMRRIEAVPGRMELFQAPGRAGVVVDYAHNAGALRAALMALRPHTGGRLWCLFGAGGDRDRGKRPLMGAAAVEGADRVILTDDNPRSEDPDAIVREIHAGMPDPDAVEIEHDRGAALAWAIERADPEDLILLAGKGHETAQVYGDRVQAWSDREAARAAVGLDGERP